MAAQLPIQLGRRAEVALERLKPQDQRRINKAIDRYATLGFPSHAATMLGVGAMGRVGLLRAGNDLRIIFKQRKHLLEIIDIVRHDKLRHFFNTFSSEGGAE